MVRRLANAAAGGALALALALALPPDAAHAAAAAASVDPVVPGRVDSFRVAGAPFADSLTVMVYLPPSWRADRPHPVAYASAAHLYFRIVRLPARLDSLAAEGVALPVVVGLPDVDSRDASRVGSPAALAYAALVVERVLPAVEARYAVRADREGRALLGFSSGANVALDLALVHPERFGRVAAQTPGWMFWDGEREAISEDFTDRAVARVAEARFDAAPPAHWFMWGDADEEWESRSRVNGARYIEALRARGAAVEGPLVVPGGHGPRLALASLRQALAFLVAGAHDTDRRAVLWRGGPARTGVERATGVPTLGGVRWTFRTGAEVWGPVVLADGLVFAGSQDSSYYAIDLATGRERWRLRTATRGNSSAPAIAGGIAYLGAGDGAVYALDARTGAERWRFATGGRVISRPLVADDAVYAGSDDGHVYALDRATGRERWRFRTGGRVVSSPAVADGVVYVGSFDGHLYALDAATGRERWRHAAGAPIAATPAVAGERIYAGSMNGRIFALARASGERAWAVEHEAPWLVSSAAVADGVVYVGSGDGHVFALDAADGRERWRFRTGGGVNVSPTVAGETVYVGSHDGRFYALDRRTGAERWRYATGGEVHSDPAIGDGVVVFGSADGVIYAIEGT